jgi:hypothetical protein
MGTYFNEMQHLNAHDKPWLHARATPFLEKLNAYGTFLSYFFSISNSKWENDKDMTR